MHEHGLNFVKEIAINTISYLASGTENYLVLRRNDNGTLLHMFSIPDMMIGSNLEGINGITEIEFDFSSDTPFLEIYAVATSNFKVFLYDSKLKRSIGFKEYQENNNKALISLIQVRGTEYLVINRLT